MEVITRAEAREKGLKRFYTGTECSRGHLAERYVSGGQCLECERLRDTLRQPYKTQLAREQYQTKPEFREKIKKRDKIQRAEYRDRIASTKRKYYHTVDKIPRAMRGMLRNVLLYTLNEKVKRTQDYYDYTPEQLKAHLEALFSPGMTWDNYGEWHIDHKKPISVMIQEGIAEPRIINALSNLQPLWAHENISKGNKYGD